MMMELKVANKEGSDDSEELERADEPLTHRVTAEHSMNNTNQIQN